MPDAWSSKAYPSLKPLSSWVLDLLERLKFINKWIADGPPPVYWISGLFFPQAFLTGTLQAFARKNQFAIDSVQWNFNVRDTMTYANTTEPPPDGCYITGFFLEGARWDYDAHLLAESRPKELYTDFPLMWLEPVKDRVDPTEGVPVPGIQDADARQGRCPPRDTPRTSSCTWRCRRTRASRTGSTAASRCSQRSCSEGSYSRRRIVDWKKSSWSGLCQVT